MGVRLSVHAREAASSESDAVYEFEQDRILIGRGSGADINLPHASVSARHAIIEQRSGRYVLIDQTSTNGSSVNGATLVALRPKSLRDGDRIEIGTFVLHWREGVPVVRGTSAIRTASLARRLLMNMLGTRDGSAKLVVLQGNDQGRTLVLPPPPARLVVGRHEACDLPLRDPDASREHFELVVDADGTLVRDLGSKNGLLINHRPLREKRLADRDEIALGDTLMVFEDATERALKMTEQAPDEEIPATAVHTIPPRTSSAPPDPPPPPPEPEPADDPDAPTGDPLPAPPPPPPRLGGAELLIYVLAIVVFVVSVAGLYFLLNSE